VAGRRGEQLVTGSLGRVRTGSRVLGFASEQGAGGSGKALSVAVPGED
jgi:hypothetical protein